jgi:hypothetical protein
LVLAAGDELPTGVKIVLACTLDDLGIVGSGMQT